jgi:post-segregation antitoxin (ccd killing protein)
MAKVTVYLPDQLAEAVRAFGLNLSHVTQVAAERELARSRVDVWLTRVITEPRAKVTHDIALQALEQPSTPPR